MITARARQRNTSVYREVLRDVEIAETMRAIGRDELRAWSRNELSAALEALNGAQLDDQLPQRGSGWQAVIAEIIDFAQRLDPRQHNVGGEQLTRRALELTPAGRLALHDLATEFWSNPDTSLDELLARHGLAKTSEPNRG